MEHSPIEELSPDLRRSLEQPKAVRVDQLQWESFRQLSRTPGVLPIDADGELALALTGNPQVAGDAVGQHHLAEYGAGRFLILDHRLQARTAE